MLEGELEVLFTSLAMLTVYCPGETASIAFLSVSGVTELALYFTMTDLFSKETTTLLTYWSVDKALSMFDTHDLQCMPSMMKVAVESLVYEGLLCWDPSGDLTGVFFRRSTSIAPSLRYLGCFLMNAGKPTASICFLISSTVIR
jgi:hypothetical protein